MADHNGVLEDVRRGMIPAHIYNDKEIFELEKERLFSRSWMFVAHESEVPEAGDYVVRRVLEDSFIISRDEKGEIRALFNMCLHRGMQVCRAEMGNASHFRCPYHGWSYRNDGRIVGLPFHKEAYGGEEGFKKKGQTLLPAPSLASYNGLIFISMDPDAEPLEDFLGDFKFYLDYYTKQSADGIELRGPQRWRVKANWKIGAENFAGDMYHTPQTHTSVVEIGLFREPKAEKRKDGTTYWAGNGGGTTYKLPEGSLEERLRYVGYPDEMIARMKEQWTPGAARRRGQGRVHGFGGITVPKHELRPQLAAGRGGLRRGAALHLHPHVAADQRERDRDPFVVRRRQERAGGVQSALLQGVSHVLRQRWHVRAGRRRELGVPDQHRRWVHGTAPAAQQPDGHAGERAERGRGPAPEEYSGPGSHPYRLQRVQPARVAAAVGRPPRASGEKPQRRCTSARIRCRHRPAAASGPARPASWQRRDRARSNPSRGGLIMSVEAGTRERGLDAVRAVGAGSPRAAYSADGTDPAFQR